MNAIKRFLGSPTHVFGSISVILVLVMMFILTNRYLRLEPVQSVTQYLIVDTLGNCYPMPEYDDVVEKATLIYSIKDTSTRFVWSTFRSMAYIDIAMTMLIIDDGDTVRVKYDASDGHWKYIKGY